MASHWNRQKKKNVYIATYFGEVHFLQNQTISPVLLNLSSSQKNTIWFFGTFTPSIFACRLQVHWCYLTACRTSCVLASGLAGMGSHSNLCSSSSRKWPLSCSWRTTASSWFHQRPAASLTRSAFSPQPPAVLAPARDSASSLPSSVLQFGAKWQASKLLACVRFVSTAIGNSTHQDCASSPTTLVDVTTGASRSLFLICESIAQIHRN